MFKARFKSILAALAALCLPVAAPVLAVSEGPDSRPNLHQWGAVTLFHGLPSNHVRAIAQDAEGVMWFGTDGGLAKYDGRRIQKVALEGMSATRVRALKLDRAGALWVGTDAGAVRLAGGEVKPLGETEGKSITSIISPQAARVVMVSEQGSIFDCSPGHGDAVNVQAINPADSPLLSVDAKARTPVQLTGAALINNSLIVGTRSRGLLSIEHGEVKEITSRPRAFFVEAMEADARGRLWFGSQTTSEDSGLYESGDLMRPAKIGAGTGTVTALRFDAQGDLWVGTDGQGAFRYREARRLERFTFENTAGGLRSNHIYSVFVDREGVVWFGTDRGVCRYDPRSIHIENVSEESESNFTRALFQSADGRLWCGTNRGLFIREKEGAVWQPVEGLASRTIYSIAEDSEGRVLVAAAAGLFAGARSKSTRSKSMRGGGYEFLRVDSAAPASISGDSVRAVCQFQGATYVASFGRGVERLDGLRRTLVWPSDPAAARERQVISLHAEKDRLWIGTALDGVFIFDGKQAVVDHALDRLKGCAVWSIDGASDDAMWFASARGLYLLRSGELVQVIESADARQVLTTKSELHLSAWCATAGGGLYRVLIGDETGAITAQIDTEQGLPSQSVFAISRATVARVGATDETLWIGTNRGVARYEPGRIAPMLSATRVMGERVYGADDLRRGLRLEYPQNSLALDVAAASSRTFPEQFLYSFSLFDGAGRLITRRLSRDSQLLMEGLRSGRYRVVALAFTKDLVASEPIAFDFEVTGAPFPWASAGLSLLLTLALVAVWWGYRQNRSLARTNSALAGANRQLADTRMQLASETESERRRIARDLHDQTLADLRRLLMLTDQLPATGGNGHRGLEPSAFRGEIESISTEIRRICEDLSPSALANVGLAAALEYALSDAVAHLPAEKKFDYEFVCDDAIEERLSLSPGVQIQIYRIVQEAVSNICRHSAATRVRLAAMIDPAGAFVIQLEDNGAGFDAKNKRAGAGRGIANIRSRASLIEAEAIWTKPSGGGTMFTLTRPRATTQHSTSLKSQL